MNLYSAYSKIRCGEQAQVAEYRFRVQGQTYRPLQYFSNSADLTAD